MMGMDVGSSRKERQHFDRVFASSRRKNRKARTQQKNMVDTKQKKKRRSLVCSLIKEEKGQNKREKTRGEMPETNLSSHRKEDESLQNKLDWTHSQHKSIKAQKKKTKWRHYQDRKQSHSD
jgi:hypothetical protein